MVVPAFRSAGTLPTLVARIHEVLRPTPHEIVLVDDGSRDGTWETIRRLCSEHPGTRGIRLGRNSGQHAALLAGIRAARFSVTVTLDDDLQNPPEEIPRLLAMLDEEGLDLVYGSPDRRSTTTVRRVGSSLLRRVLSRLTGLELQHLSPFRAFRTGLRDAAAQVTGPRVVIDAVLLWGSGQIGHLEVAHAPRSEGESGYGTRRLLSFALDMVTGYSTRPLRATTWLGFSSAVFGVGVLAYVLGRYLLSGASVAGFPFLASTIAIFAGAQMVALGIIGEYLARMHLRLIGQPTYLVAEEVMSADESIAADRNCAS